MTYFKTRSLTIFICLSLSFLIQGQEKIYTDVIKKIRDEGFNHSKVDEYIWTISDLHGPRLAGSPNLRQTQEWAKKTIDQYGLVKNNCNTFRFVKCLNLFWRDSFRSWVTLIPGGRPSFFHV